MTARPRVEPIGAGPAVTEPPAGAEGLYRACGKLPPQVGVQSPLRQVNLSVSAFAMMAGLITHERGIGRSPNIAATWQGGGRGVYWSCNNKGKRSPGDER
jgi:hypothetical protein